MKYRHFLLALFFLLMTPLYALDQNTYPFTSMADSSRFQSLTKEIRCVVCQNQNIADSNAPLANDLREKVYRMIIDHKSDEDIKDYLVKRYGEFILLRPRFNKLTVLLWLFPFIALASILFLFIRLQKRAALPSFNNESRR